MKTNEQISTLGTLVKTFDGHVRGPRYGEVYTSPKGERGFVAGYRSHANPGLGLMGREWFATVAAALDYAVECSDN